jgi:hypothetical protein
MASIDMSIAHLRLSSQWQRGHSGHVEIAAEGHQAGRLVRIGDPEVLEGLHALIHPHDLPN